MTGSAFVFDMGLSLMVAHEMDAVRAHEWRLLPVLASLPDRAGRDAFVLVHAPLLMGCLWITAAPAAGAGGIWRAALDVFFVVRVVLHRVFLHHPLYDFHDVGSRCLIPGAGVAGASDLALIALVR